MPDWDPFYQILYGIFSHFSCVDCALLIRASETFSSAKLLYHWSPTTFYQKRFSLIFTIQAQSPTWKMSKSSISGRDFMYFCSIVVKLHHINRFSTTVAILRIHSLLLLELWHIDFVFELKRNSILFVCESISCVNSTKDDTKLTHMSRILVFAMLMHVFGVQAIRLICFYQHHEELVVVSSRGKSNRMFTY